MNRKTARRALWLAGAAMLATTAVIGGTLATAEPAAPAEGAIVNAGAEGAVAGRYVVVLKDTAADAVDRLAAKYGATVENRYRATIRGFSARMAETQAKRLAADSAVSSVEAVRTVKAPQPTSQPAPARQATRSAVSSWGLDRVNQRDLPLDGDSARPRDGGAGVTAYILDSGVRLTHEEFEGRATSGWDFVDNDPDASDACGHGTHVAGTVAGKTFGVAPAARIVSVRVQSCGVTLVASDSVLAGVDWVTANAKRPAVVNMSLGYPGSSPALENAVRRSIASGITYTIAAGNFYVPACTFYPANVREAITVANSNQKDHRSAESQWGDCVDIIAPGTDIVSSTFADDRSSGPMSGTSMAAPHVAGAAALYLARNPDASPEDVRRALVDSATKDKIGWTLPGTPNLLLYTGSLGE
ncbi:subtilisin family serine protease [Herbihabitans rhizosphaerae]|uniref:Subtilisin family serine protease n=1 Tax=Herbihabitans rhizosphaerae TaxID=1872711 RepID=A0A4Q7KKT9_9PSEU|nr:S8 family peptidase [Herbihabitans rhizosphaerae]RZS36837.1 subtilisin family serine protease [Herbihabitans rhizosphaerae]